MEMNYSDIIDGIHPLQCPLTKEILSLNIEGNQQGKYIPTINSCSKFVAITTDQTLSIFKADLSTSKNEAIFEMDFDQSIVSIIWDLSESCLILADISGSLHLVTCDGCLLFSKKIVNDAKNQRIIHLQFLPNDQSTNYDQTLYAIMDNGSVLVINNMDPRAILESSRNTPELVASHFQKLTINKESLCITNKINQAIILPSTIQNKTQGLKVLLKDESEQLLLLQLPNMDQSKILTQPSVLQYSHPFVITTHCSDFHIFEYNKNSYALVLINHQEVVVFELSTRQRIAQMKSKSNIRKISIVTSSSKPSIASEDIDSKFGIYQMLFILHIVDVKESVTASNTKLEDEVVSDDTYSQLLSLSILNGIGKLLNISTILKSDINIHHLIASSNHNCLLDINIDNSHLFTTVSNSNNCQEIKVHKYSEILSLIWNDLQISYTQNPRNIQISTSLSMKSIALLLNDYHRVSINKDEETSSYESESLNDNRYINLITSLVSFTDILNLTYLLLDFPNPKTGFIMSLLIASENTIEKIQAKQNQQAIKQKCLLEILKLHHYYETAEMIINLNANKEQYNMITSKEEKIRHCLLSLLPNNISDTIVKHLTFGDIQEAIIIIQRCLHGELVADHAKYLHLIPDQTPAYQIIAWIKEIVLCNITSLNFISSLSSQQELLNVDYNMMMNIMSVASELITRAQKMEKVSGNPFDAIKLLSLAIEITAVIPYSYEDAIPLMNHMKALYKNMKLQATVWEQWDDHFSLEDVSSLGFKGLVFDRIDCIPESELIDDIKISIIPLVVSFYDAGIDSLLMGWIKESIATRIVIAGDDIANDTGDEKENCSFTRLVKVTSLIQDKNIQAKMVLTLLQMPVLEEMTTSNMTLNIEDDADIFNNLNKKACKQSIISSHYESTRVLCDLAASTYDYVDAATRDALVEATRLLKVKAIASNYGIEAFDPRNSKQVRAVVSIIANSVGSPNAIRDAVEFAASWGANSIDINAVLMRALILRATNYKMYNENNMKYESDLKQALEILPNIRKHIIIEDSITYLLDEIEEVTEYLVYDPMKKSVAKGEEEFNAEILVRCTMILVSYYIEFVKSDQDYSSIGSTAAAIASNDINNNKNRDQFPNVSPVTAASNVYATKKRVKIQSSMNRCWINSELLVDLKRIHSLQSYGIYLCLHDVDDKEICQAVVSKLAKCRGMLLLQSLSENNGFMIQDDQQNKINTQSRLTSLNTPLNSTCRKICVLLNICTTFFIHTTMKFLVESSETDLAMEVAQTLTKEKLLYSSNNFTSYAQNTSDYISANGTSRDINASEIDVEAMKETSLLLDAAVTLCSIAAKKANQISQEDTNMLPSLSLLGCDEIVPEYISFPIASFKLSRDLLRSSVICCPSLYLGRTLDLIHGSEMVLSVYDRIEGVNKSIHCNENNSYNFEAISGVISDGSFARDGILMQPQAIVLPLMKFAFGEIKRREIHSFIVKSSNQKEGAHNKSNNGSILVEQSAPDLEEIVRILQRSENHLLAARILYGSWHNSSFKAKALSSSLLSLGRKVLTYRDIDVPFSVACLAALSYETMVKELKSAVPNIQSDFSRLQIVALVGEELSHLWDQESLLLLFQGLQTNAKWWSILSSLGMKVDLRVFQNPDANIREKSMKAIIPDLFEKGNMDLDMVLEYCRQFDLEPEYATLTYIELLLIAPSKSTYDFSWVSKVRNASENVQDSGVLLKLKELLPKTNPYDYEKIRYVCTWIMDLLASAEEEVDSPIAIELTSELENIPPSKNNNTVTPPTNSRSSLKDKALKVPVARISKSMENSTVNLSEIECYKRYFDIATYLAGLKFPKEATEAITIVHETYKRNIVDSYQERIPIWQLFNDPWSVLDPLLTEAPECASKLAPLCLPLKIDKVLFNSRKIMALYTRMTAKRETSTQISESTGNEYSAAHRECKAAAIATATESIETSIPNTIQQLELWKMIYLKERANADDEFSILALDNASKIIKKSPKFDTTNIIDKKLLTLESINQEMRYLKCEQAIKRFHLNCLIEVPQIKDLLLNTISNPMLLLRYLLDITIEIAWDKYTQDLQLLLGASVVTELAITNYPPSHDVLAFIQKASIVIDEIAQYCDLNSPLQTSSTQSQDSNNQATMLQTTQLEILRHHLIGKMLSDIDNNSHSNNNTNSYDKDGIHQLGNSNFSSHSINSTLGTSGTTNGMKINLWGSGISEEFAYLPSSAEKRRREDLHLSLSIAALVLSCSNIKQRQAYMTQLDTVFRGKGVRVMRRLTARSKYRACQALSYLQMYHNTHSSGPSIPNVSIHELNLYRNYLYCLSEMHEIRLPCSDEILLDAMGLSIVENEIQKVHVSDPRALVRTWIHDEGIHSEVVELARDLLLICHYDEIVIWYQLIQHMINKSQHRVLLQTLLVINKSKVFSELCFGMLGCELLSVASKLYSETIDRVEKTIQLAQLREQQEHSTNTTICNESDWLSISTCVNTTVSSTNTSNGTIDVHTSDSHKRIFLSPKLSYRTGEWEESPPEDVLLSFYHIAIIIQHISHNMSTRMKTQVKSITSMNSIQNDCQKIISLLNDNKCNRNNKRNVLKMSLQSIMFSLNLLLDPSVYDVKPVNNYDMSISPLSSSHSCISKLVVILEGLGLDGNKDLLSDILDIIVNKFDKDVVDGVLTNFIISSNQEGMIASKQRLTLLFEVIGMNVTQHNYCSEGDSDKRTEQLAIVLIQSISKRMVANELDIAIIKEAVLEQSTEVKKNLIKQMKNLVTKKNINIDNNIQMLIQAILS